MTRMDPAPQADLAIHRARVLDLHGPTRLDVEVDILVRDGRIVRIAPSARASPLTR
jgi:N-acyl-D-aspartate/D-glutamate deacylase